MIHLARAGKGSHGLKLNLFEGQALDIHLPRERCRVIALPAGEGEAGKS